MNSIEWLVEQMQNNIHHTIKIPSEYVEQAKEIHMVETLLFAKKYNEHISKGGIDTMEEYYKEMFEQTKKD
jgi:hypothetical protein